MVFTRITSDPNSRIKDIYDRAEPAANAMFIQIGLDMAKKHHDMRYFEFASDVIYAFLGSIKSSSIGADGYWLGVLNYWQAFQLPSDLISVQFVSAKWMTQTTVSIVLDLFVA